MKYFIVIICLVLTSCKDVVKQNKNEEVYYTCSMDPQVMESKPGKCPICKMDLTPVKKSSRDTKGELELSEQQLRLGNIHVDTIRNGTIGDETVLTATLNFDQMKVVALSSRVMGRIEKLYYKNMGDHVRKGAPLFEIYSEDLNNAKQEYLLALDKKAEFQNETVINFDQLLMSAKNKLLLWGMSDAQISDLAYSRKASPTTTIYANAGGTIISLEIREGDYVMEGGSIVKLADLSTLWAEAQVYTSQLSGLNRASTARVQLPDLDGRELRGRLEFVNPEISPDTRINLVRVSIPNPGNILKPGMPAYVIMKSPERKTLSLPIDAVIRDSKGATVWIRSASKMFKPVMVKTGLEIEDRIEIISGLNEGDVVVTSGAYLLHSEYVFRKGADPMAGHNH